MATTVSSLREAYNSVHIVGWLEENNLTKEEKVFNRGTPKEEKRTCILGNLVIKVSDEEKYKVQFFANEFTKNGNPSKVFAGLETVMDEYVSRAEAISKGLPESEITKLEVNGAKINVYDHYDVEHDVMYNSPVIRANFVNRIEEGKPFNPQAIFDVEAYFESMEPEKDEEGKETGRVKVEGIIPLYDGSVIPLTMYTTTDTTYGDIGKYLLENYSTGKTGSIGGSIVCHAETNTISAKGFGNAKEKTFTNYKYEYIIERGGETQYLITDNKNFDKKDIKAAMLYREEQLDKIKEGKKQIANSSADDFATSRNGFGNTVISNSTREIEDW